MIILFEDFRYAVRRLRKSPSFTITCILTLAMAIGANSVVFSVMNGLILRSLNVPQAESLYLIERARDKSTNQSYPDYLDFRDRNHSFDGLTAYGVTQVSLDTGEGPSLTWGVESSSNYFDVLRIRRIWVVSSTLLMTLAQTALLTSSSATPIGTATFTMIAVSWAALFN